MKKVIGCIALVFLFGCATSDVLIIGAPQVPTRPEDIEILIEEPTESYMTIAIIEASDQGWNLGLEELKTKIVRDAARLGGDAVILGERRVEEGITTFTPIGNTLYATTLKVKKLVGKVISWKPAEG